LHLHHQAHQVKVRIKIYSDWHMFYWAVWVIILIIVKVRIKIYSDWHLAKCTSPTLKMEFVKVRIKIYSDWHLVPLTSVPFLVPRQSTY
jgi:hypothetical protein